MYLYNQTTCNKNGIAKTNIKLIPTLNSCKIMSNASKVTMNLKQFMMRQKVLSLYKDILRTIKCVPEENDRKYLKEWAKRDFKNNSHHTDEYSIKIMLKHGEQSLKELRQTLELSHSTNN